MWHSGGNFILTAKGPKGPWSDPVWIPTPGLDPTLFWDDDGRSYYIGNRYPIQNIGHADMFRAADGNLYAVCLGNRTLLDNDGQRYSPLGRETFLTRVEFQGDQLVFAPGAGRVGINNLRFLRKMVK